MGAVLQEILGLLFDGIVTVANGIGTGVSTLTEKLFLVTTSGGGYALSTFGGVVCIFGGIGLAISLSVKIFNWIQSLGAN